MALKSTVELEKDYLAWLVVSRPFSNQSLLFAIISMFMYYLGDIKPGIIFLYTRICGHNFMILNPLSQVFKFTSSSFSDWLESLETFKDVTHDLKTHAGLMKFSGQTIFDVLSSNLKSLSRYYLYFISYASSEKLRISLNNTP